MEDFDLTKSFDDLLKPTDPPKEAALENTTEVPDITYCVATNNSRTIAL